MPRKKKDPVREEDAGSEASAPSLREKVKDDDEDTSSEAYSPSPNEIRLKRRDDANKRDIRIVTSVLVLVIAAAVYIFMPSLSAHPTDYPMTAYIQDARLALGKNDAGESAQVLVATLCNLRNKKASYSLQLRPNGVEDPQTFTYRIKPATCAHITLRLNDEPNHYRSCQLMLSEAFPTSLFGLRPTYVYKDAFLALSDHLDQ